MRDMPTLPCIFCPKSYHRALQTVPPLESFGARHSAGILRTAIPTFNGRVSPVLDTCTQLLVVESSEKERAVNRTVPMKGASIFERAGELKRLELRVIICGAVSEAFYNLLREAGIDLVCGITGDIDEVVAAFRNGTLGHPRFRMPGSE
jgi:predicted Fe-Mo cluster-binding NifX family protein